MAAEQIWYDLRNAVAAADFGAAAKLLTDEPRLKLLRNGIDETVLHYQAVENDSHGVAWLAAQGFDLNTRNHTGTPVVFEVASLGYQQLFLWFVSMGADLMARDGDGLDLIAYLREFQKDDMIAFIHAEVASERLPP